MKMKKNNLSKKSRELLASFESAAMAEGYYSDQGNAEQAAAAREGWIAAKDALEKHLLRLERIEKQVKERKKGGDW